ncbi:MAG: DUF5615 family PIN-like protein [Chloroflexi bacterium]|nr:DUF5615 family PIN-like protein [Chloroflexota bacterium]
MSKPKLHLDEDASRNALFKALISNGHDVTRTPNEWITKRASDDEQLQKASEQGRSIFSYNAKDFLRIANKTPKHKGIIVSKRKPFSVILKARGAVPAPNDAPTNDTGRGDPAPTINKPSKHLGRRERLRHTRGWSSPC